MVNAGWIWNLSPGRGFGSFGSFGNFGSGFFVELHPRERISIGFVTRFELERDFKRARRLFVPSQRQVSLTHASSGVMSGTVNMAFITNRKLDDSYYSPGFGPFGFDLNRAFRVGERAGRVVHLETHRGAVTPAPRVTGRD